MDDDSMVRNLLDFIFLRERIDSGKLSVASFITKDFSLCMSSVLNIKQAINICRWQKFIDTCCYKMFDSHESYLKYMMFVCRTEHGFHKNIFESFISICAVLHNLNDEIIEKTSMDLSCLNPDIVYVFYKSVMKKNFRKSGSFRKFTEFILSHRYLELNAPGIPLTSLNPSKATKLAEEMNKDKVFEVVVKVDDINEDYACGVLANKCLGSTSEALPDLLSKPELIQKLIEFRRSQIPKMFESKLKIEDALKSGHLKTSHSNRDSTTRCVPKEKQDFAQKMSGSTAGALLDLQDKLELIQKLECRLSQLPKVFETKLRLEDALKAGHLKTSHSNLESTTRCVPKEKQDFAQGYDAIIEAVMKLNQSKNPDMKNSDYNTLKKADGILEHLKDRVKSLIEVLDGYDEK